MGNLIVEDRPFTIHLALADHGKLLRWHIIDKRQGVEGAVFAARVTRVVPELGGAFADLGQAEPALVRLSTAQRRGLSEGTRLTVQGARDGSADKPPRATGNLRFEGQYMVWRGDRSTPAIDEHVTGPHKATLAARLPELALTGPLALRAAAGQAGEDVLRAEAQALAADAEFCLASGTRVGRIDDLARLVRRSLRPWPAATGARVYVRSDQRLRLQRLIGRDATDFSSAENPWVAAGAAEARDSVLGTELKTASGVRLSLAHTPAGITIDVDRAQSSQSASQINAEAAEAVADQIVVAGLAGQIIIDFLDPGSASARTDFAGAILATLQMADPEIRLVGAFGSGLTVLERPRRGLALRERLFASCRNCGQYHGEPAPWWRLEDALVALAQTSDPRATCLVSPALWSVLQQPGWREDAVSWLSHYGRSIDGIEIDSCAAEPWRLLTRVG